MYRGAKVKVLNKICLRIEKGESVCLRGHSGTGKTTLLNIIGGMLAPSSGIVKVNGSDLARMPQHFLSEFRRNHIGFIFQQFNLLYNFTVMENLLFPLIPSGKSLSKEKLKIMKLLDRLQISHRAEFYINYLSGGEQQRVAIARAMVSDPAIIIADEPFSNLDEKNIRFTLEIFDELKRQGKTFVVSAVSLPSDLEKNFFDREIRHAS
jgi:putative ABC transport system ATP-binding protein